MVMLTHNLNSNKKTMSDIAEYCMTEESAKALDFTVASVRPLVYKKT